MSRAPENMGKNSAHRYPPAPLTDQNQLTDCGADGYRWAEFLPMFSGARDTAVHPLFKEMRINENILPSDIRTDDPAV